MNDTPTPPPIDVDAVQQYVEPDGSVPPPPAEQAQQDYFGFGGSFTHMLPDGVSYVELKIMTEGDRRKYLNKTSRSLKIDRQSGTQSMDMRLGEDVRELLLIAITGWNLVSGGRPVIFNRAMLEKFLDSTDPKIVNEIDRAVRMGNPWLTADTSIEDLERERDSIQELIDKRREEEEGKASS